MNLRMCVCMCVCVCRQVAYIRVCVCKKEVINGK